MLSTDRDFNALKNSSLADRAVVFWHPGGPGLSPARLLERSSGLLDPQVFAVIAWDGPTAATTSGACGEESLAYGEDRDALADLVVNARRVARECRADVGPEGVPVASAAEADYLEAIRVALGLSSVRVWASSYGAAIVEKYAAAHPDRLDAAVVVSPFFEGVQPLDRLSAMSSVMTAVEARWADLCAQECTSDLRRVARGGWGRVKAAVIAKQPRVGSGTQVLSRTQFDQALVSASRESDADRDILDMVEAAYAGDGSPMAQVSDAYFFGVDRSVYYSVLCPHMVLEGTARAAAERVTRGNASQALFSEFAPCAEWQAERAQSSGLGEAVAAKVLVVSGEHDVLSPPQLLDHVGWTSHAKRCELAGSGHVPGAGSNPTDLISVFLSSGAVNAEIASRLCRGAEGQWTP